MRTREHTQIWKRTQKRTCTHAHMRSNYVNTQMHAHAHAHIHTRTPTHARAHARTHAHMHARTHARMHARTHACTHARTQGLSPRSQEMSLELVQSTQNFLGITFTTPLLRWSLLSSLQRQSSTRNGSLQRQSSTRNGSPRPPPQQKKKEEGEMAVTSFTQVEVEGDVVHVQTADKQVGECACVSQCVSFPFP